MQEAFHGCPILLADREQVEQGAGELLAGAHDSNVALLVVGDPLGATTHTDLMLRAKESGIPVTVIITFTLPITSGLLFFYYLFNTFDLFLFRIIIIFIFLFAKII